MHSKALFRWDNSIVNKIIAFCWHCIMFNFLFVLCHLFVSVWHAAVVLIATFKFISQVIFLLGHEFHHTSGANAMHMKFIIYLKSCCFIFLCGCSWKTVLDCFQHKYCVVKCCTDDNQSSQNKNWSQIVVKGQLPPKMKDLSLSYTHPCASPYPYDVFCGNKRCYCSQFLLCERIKLQILVAQMPHLYK